MCEREKLAWLLVSVFGFGTLAFGIGFFVNNKVRTVEVPKEVVRTIEVPREIVREVPKEIVREVQVAPPRRNAKTPGEAIVGSWKFVASWSPRSSWSPRGSWNDFNPHVTTFITKDTWGSYWGEGSVTVQPGNFDRIPMSIKGENLKSFDLTVRKNFDLPVRKNFDPTEHVSFISFSEDLREMFEVTFSTDLELNNVFLLFSKYVYLGSDTSPTKGNP